MTFIKPTRVRAEAHRNGKRCPRAWLVWLDGRVQDLIERECAALGGRKTLNFEDSELRRRLRGTWR